MTSTALRSLPLPVLLLPAFFVLHGYAENLGYINGPDALLLTFYYSAVGLLLFCFFLLLYKKSVKASVAATVFLSIHFFFGGIHDFLAMHTPFLLRYSVLLTALSGFALSMLIVLKKTKQPLLRLNLFLSTLLILFIFLDMVTLATGNKANEPSVPHRQDLSLRSCPSCRKPDIYFLVFDAYQGSASLKEKYHYDNSSFDNFLMDEGFRLQRQSKANYKYTILSMPSILNMHYLDGLQNVKGGPLQEYYYLSDLIKNNQVTSFLQSQGYEIVNCSIFDLKGNPSPINESLLPLKTRLITDQTLYSRCLKDIGWHLFQFSENPLAETALTRDLRNNEAILAQTKKAIAAPSSRPRFVYTHLNMPHPPYYFDKDGKRRKVQAAYTPQDEDDADAYLNYLGYTNSVARNLIGNIRRANPGAAIIFMGDHGLRFHDSLGYNPPWFLQNQNAVFLPDGLSAQLYDSISGVNQFRVVLNALFKQNIPLLKDSTVNVKDKK